MCATIILRILYKFAKNIRMELFDNHNHSQFSFDGWRTTVEQSVISAMEKGLGGICFTDHCDFATPEMGFEDPLKEVFDVDAQQKEIDRVREIYSGIKVLKGIEVGVNKECRVQLAEILSVNSFDQIIASVHYIDGMDPFKGEYYSGRTWKEAYSYYLELLWDEMKWLGDRFDIMGHYDYVTRYGPYPETSITYRDFSDWLEPMLRYLAENGKALEINTKTYQDFKGRVPVIDSDVLKRYRELGGEIISFGSDSHNKDMIGFNFIHFAEYIKSLGFRYTAHYENRKLCMTRI